LIIFFSSSNLVIFQVVCVVSSLLNSNSFMSQKTLFLSLDNTHYVEFEDDRPVVNEATVAGVKTVLFLSKS